MKFFQVTTEGPAPLCLCMIQSDSQDFASGHVEVSHLLTLTDGQEHALVWVVPMDTKNECKFSNLQRLSLKISGDVFTLVPELTAGCGSKQRCGLNLISECCKYEIKCRILGFDVDYEMKKVGTKENVVDEMMKRNPDAVVVFDYFVANEHDHKDKIMLKMGIDDVVEADWLFVRPWHYSS